MTIAISLNVNAGLVMAADSASAVVARMATGQIGVLQIYSYANKLFQLGSYPIGILTWGTGGFGETSVEDAVHTYAEKQKDRKEVSVEAFAREFEGYIRPLYEKIYGSWPQKPPLGFMVCGFSQGRERPEEYTVLFPNAEIIPIRKPGESGLTWNGEIEAITRLEKGMGLAFVKVLQEMGVREEQMAKFDSLQRAHLEANLFHPTMPIQDAIDLARFLIRTTIEFERFKPGAPTCGGPIDVAVVTRREGFRWVERKGIR